MVDLNPTSKKVTMVYVFKTIVWPRKKFLFFGLILIVISRLAGLVLPAASKFLIDDIIPSKDIDLLLWLVVAIVVATIIQAVTSYGLIQVLSIEAHRLIAQLRAKIHKHIIRLPIRFFDNTKKGELVSRVMIDVEGVRNLVGSGLVQLVGAMFSSIVCFVILTTISPLLVLYVLGPVVIFVLIHYKAFGRVRPIYQERSKIYAKVTGRLTESLGGIRVIKGFNAEEQEIRIFGDSVFRLFLNVKKSLVAEGIVTSTGGFFLGLASAGIMGGGSYLIINGQLTLGEFLAFTLYLGYLIEPVLQMNGMTTQFSQAFAGLDRMIQIMNLPLEADEEDRPLRVKKIWGDIEFDRVNFAYEKGNDVLRGLNFKVPAGSVTALVGPSGSGKSTIAGLVASFLNPASGTITVDGYNLRKINLDSYRSRLGVVLQEDFLFEGTIKENILFSNPDASESELLQAVTAAHIKEFTDCFADGLDTLIGERGVKLSGGQCQRITIARAILANPRILILDEATSNLDTESEALIQDSLKELMKGRTTIVIAHRLSTIIQADQILVIEQGCIVEKGKHEELIKIKGRYYELYTRHEKVPSC